MLLPSAEVNYRKWRLSLMGNLPQDSSNCFSPGIGNPSIDPEESTITARDCFFPYRMFYIAAASCSSQERTNWNNAGLNFGVRWQCSRDRVARPIVVIRQSIFRLTARLRPAICLNLPASLAICFMVFDDLLKSAKPAGWSI